MAVGETNDGAEPVWLFMEPVGYMRAVPIQKSDESITENDQNCAR
jgi:hypothetical protein